jgi:hypothetical protein
MCSHFLILGSQMPGTKNNFLYQLLLRVELSTMFSMLGCKSLEIVQSPW